MCLNIKKGNNYFLDEIVEKNQQNTDVAKRSLEKGFVKVYDHVKHCYKRIYFKIVIISSWKNPFNALVKVIDIVYL